MAQKTNVTRELAKLQQSVEALRTEKISVPKEPPRTFLSKMGKWLGFLANISSLGIPIITIYLSFSNFIYVPPTDSLIENDPLTIPFVIENNSYVNLKDIKIMVQMLNVNGESQTGTKITYTNVGIINNFLENMTSNSSHTLLFKPDTVIAPKLTKIYQADVQINISYRAFFFSKSFNQKFRFVALPSQEGFYRYFPIQSTL